ncbi:MAG: cytosolic protein, partial [Candidatus Kapaibacteriota bacterium]
MNTPEPIRNNDYDTPWKEAIEQFFAEFMAMFFPEAAAKIDWSAGYEFLDKELQQIVRDAELGKRFADKLVRVRLAESGDEQVIIVHLEIQGQHDPDFAS